MYPDWLIRALEGAQAFFDLPTGTLLGLDTDLWLHWGLTLVIVTGLVAAGRPLLALVISVSLALLKEALDLAILVHYRDLRWIFVSNTLLDLLAAGLAIAAGVWLGRAWRKRHGTPTDRGPGEGG